jgi:CRP/FNR family transcriptional regulator, anaerobic regulatory protein
MHPIPDSPIKQEGMVSNVISIRDLRVHCATCSMRELCLPIGLAPDVMRELDALITVRRHFNKGESVFNCGDRFAALYAIRSGSCKITVPSEDGREQVSGYHIMGDIMGFDGIGDGRHGGQAIALEDTEVCEIPFAHLEELCQLQAPLQHNLHRLLSREITRDENLLLVLGSMRAEERVVAFLLNLSHRYRQRGYSSTEFVLRMTRGEIGSYLGLTLETVSRVFSHLQEQGAIKVENKVVQLLNLPALRAMMDENE